MHLNVTQKMQDQSLYINKIPDKASTYKPPLTSAVSVRKVNFPGNFNDQELPKSISITNQSQPPSKSSSLLSAERLITGDRIIAPDICTVYRTVEERASNPDRLNLDRRRLLFCPVLEGEDNLRLLNYQHNLISKIENVSNLKRLIFLDLYDNDIQGISNLDSLKFLRVLMLGKNRISKINNLDSLKKLDVLDLHGNKICVIENLSHLTELRVLNLAGNMISKVDNLSGMESLTELNLRRNRIQDVLEIDCLRSLQRLYLSFNDISRFSDVDSVFKCSSLLELALDGNPISQFQHYKFNVIKNAPQIKQLDLKRITDEERRNAWSVARKEEEKKQEHSKITAIKEKRQQAIDNAKRDWDIRQKSILPHTKRSSSQAINEGRAQHVKTVSNVRSSSLDPSQKSKTSLEDKSCRRAPGLYGNSSNTSSVPPRLGHNHMCDSPATVPPSLASPSTTQKYFSSNNNKMHLAQIDGDTLNLYGQGALDAFDRNWGVQAAGAVTNVLFSFMEFEEIAKHLYKMRVRFPAVNSLVLNSTNFHSLHQINAFSSLHHLNHLNIEIDGNPVTLFSLWRYYAIFRLEDCDLISINGLNITQEEREISKQLFSGLVDDIAKIPNVLLQCIVNDARLRSVLNVAEVLGQDKDKKSGQRSLDAPSRSCKNLLIYRLPSDEKKIRENVERKQTATKMVDIMFSDVIQHEQKFKELHRVWPHIFSKMVTDAVHDMTDIQHYSKRWYDQFLGE